MKSFIFVFVLGTCAQAWRWPWESKPEAPEWSQLSVTWGKFDKLPQDKDAAIKTGWTLTASCDAANYFAGNRYVLKGDTAVMLLFDSKGKIAGIQNGIPKSAVGDLRAPWIREGDNYVITAYFTDPETICSGPRPVTPYLGDQLLLQTGNKISNTMSIPFKQEDLAGTKWVRGGCFPSMGKSKSYLFYYFLYNQEEVHQPINFWGFSGRHYWYNISPDMDCRDFYPMFLLYNRDRLTGFGWVAIGNADSPRYEHPPAKRLGLGFFLSATKPKCIANLKSLTTQHVYLDKRPYLNFCFI
ncbi:hypothetical protein pdam_00015753 [Pocillopora damicornis]|uniref:DOMON domain-containing protein n=1 Tax=Pocillopora damicornis TaxID=46731 RepID=A0A3M6T6X6_POCDA|nr:hypothetical protein pdam_00015753 [Pocillopora damicornis]